LPYTNRKLADRLLHAYVVGRGPIAADRPSSLYVIAVVVVHPKWKQSKNASTDELTPNGAADRPFCATVIDGGAFKKEGAASSGGEKFLIGGLQITSATLV
jgi:hypothetical protein